MLIKVKTKKRRNNGKLLSIVAPLICFLFTLLLTRCKARKINEKNRKNGGGYFLFLIFGYQSLL
jgi:hypothetical protein